MFRLNRNERSHWSGNGVHVESELVFMIGRNMQHRVQYANQKWCSKAYSTINVLTLDVLCIEFKPHDLTELR